MATPMRYSKSFSTTDDEHHSGTGSRPHSNTLPEGNKLSTSAVSLASPGTLKEGCLYKRQRGRKAHDLRGLKFQQRYCVLTHNGSLAYYPTKKDRDVGHKPSGTYQVAKIKIVEKVPDKTFKKPCCFQIGNEKEVMYFYTTSDLERDKWIETLRIAAFDLRKNQPLPHYHKGAFGQHDKNQWSCCNKIGREATGCELNTTQAAENRIDRQGSLPPDIESVRVTVTSPAPHPAVGYSISLPVTSSIPPGLDSVDSGSDRDSEYGGEELEPPTSPCWQSELSLQSEDSGKGSMYDLGYVNSPGIARRGSSGIHRLKRDPTTSSLAISEISEDIESLSCPLVYKCKATIEPEKGDSSHTATVLYRGADSLITVSNSGQVSLILKVNTPTPQKQTLFPVREEDVSISVWDKYIALGSSRVQIGSLDETRKLKSGHSEEDFLNLVAFTPHGTLCTASKGGNLVCSWPRASEWSGKTSVKPMCRLKVGEDGDKIFSLTVSPHPERPFVAVGVTSGKDSASDFLYVYNYETKEMKHSIEINQQFSSYAAFTHDGQHLFISSDVQLQCLNTTDWNEHDKFYYSFRHGGASISSLCCSPVRHHLAVGLTTGEVKVFMGDPSKSTPTPFSITTEKGHRSAVTSLSYSRDGMKTAIAFTDGTVQIWKGSKPPEERPLVRTGTLEVTSKGLTYHSKEDGYTIKIPEGALKAGSCIRLHYGVVPDSPFGPYTFKERARIVSSIVSVCPEPCDTEFLKPIEITLPHCAQCVTPEHCNRLCFYKTRHENFENENGTKIYQFERVTDGTVSHFSQYYGESRVPQGAATLYTIHCCDFCIAEYYEEDRLKKLTNHAPLNYSLHQIVPKNPDALQVFEVHYCLSYFLHTCVQRVEEQYPSEHYDKEEWPVSFLPSDSGNRNRKLTMNVDSRTLSGGWQLQAGKIEIAEHDVCFWDYPLWYIKDKCQKKEYPPKISLRVQRGVPIPTGVKIKVSFAGVERFRFGRQPEFTLELVKASLSPIEAPPTLQSNGMYSNKDHFRTDSTAKQHHPSSSSISSFSSSKSAASVVNPEPFTDALEKFQDNFDEIANNVSCQKLASALFSCSSKRKCPYLADDKPCTDLTRSFLDKAKAAPRDDNFHANFEILSDAYSIAKKHTLYIQAIQEALVRALPNPVKEQLGYASPSHHRRRSTSNSGYVTPEESLPYSPVTPHLSISSNGFTPNHPNGLIHPQPQTFFSQQVSDPTV